MNGFISILISFVFCNLLKLQREWFLFTPIFLVMNIPKIRKSAFWEIPMGTSIASTIIGFGADYAGELFRILFIAAAVIIPISRVKRAPIFFVAAILLLISNNNELGVYAMTAAVWCSAAYAFIPEKNEETTMLNNTCQSSS